MNTPPTTEEAVVLREDQAGVTTLWLNRPRQFNALSEEVLTALQQELEDIAQNEAIRVVVLAAKGKAFCAGHDLKQMRASPSEEYYQDLFNQCSRMMMTINKLPQPIIARVQGLATAAGCQLVAACDLAVAADTAQFATSGIRFGLFCSTPAVAVSRNLSRKKALEMLLTGDMVDADRALEIGLVSAVVPDEELLDAAYALAGRMTANAPLAVQAAKKALRMSRAGDGSGLRAFLGPRLDDLLKTSDHQESVAAFLEKRVPSYRGR